MGETFWTNSIEHENGKITMALKNMIFDDKKDSSLVEQSVSLIRIDDRFSEKWNLEAIPKEKVISLSAWPQLAEINENDFVLGNVQKTLVHIGYYSDTNLLDEVTISESGVFSEFVKNMKILKKSCFHET